MAASILAVRIQGCVCPCLNKSRDVNNPQCSAPCSSFSSSPLSLHYSTYKFSQCIRGLSTPTLCFPVRVEVPSSRSHRNDALIWLQLLLHLGFRFQSGNPVMEMIRLSSMEQYHSLPKNQWNIKQPPDDEQIESVFDRGALDLVLVPGLAFTRKGDRLGRGKGYYDRFLARCKRELASFPYTIGLAFSEQIVPEIPTDHYDFPLDLIVSPQ